MGRPRILLVPTVTEVEWTIKPLLEEWAEVASFDAPGVGGEPATETTREAIVARGLAEIGRRRWDSCVIVGDEAGAVQAVRIAGATPRAVRAIALGHPALSFKRTGARRGLNGEVFDALLQVARTDYRSFVRALCQLTQHAYDDEMADRYMERVPQEVALPYMERMLSEADAEQVEPTLRELQVPMLLVEHRGCIAWTAESFDDAVAAFPEASTASVEIKPSCSPEFAEILKRFCEELPSREGIRAKQAG
jgi:pimeloyl-ACP methyl ester carboxylesterase